MLLMAIASIDSLIAGTVVIPGLPGSDISVRITSKEEARFRTTVRQRYDYSCGSAALATLLTYHYDHPATETGIFKWMFEHGDQDKIRRVGFSMLDMKRYLEAKGYSADGYKVTLDQLASASIPAIVLIELKGYKHFVVVKGITGKHVLVGDSSTGTRVVARSAFESIWKGLAFVLNPSEKHNAASFNNPAEWRASAHPVPLGLALGLDELANINFLLPGPGGAGP